MQADPVYTPIEDVLARPRVRILRALRWFDWVSAVDLFAALDLSDWEAGGDNRERNNYTSALHHLAKTGLVEQEHRSNGTGISYRVTDAGRANLAKTLRRYEQSVSAARRAA